MKRSMFLLVCLSVLTASSAQVYERNIFGVRGGMNASSISFPQELPSSVKRPAKIGWHVGVSDQILFSQAVPLYLETGIYLSNKGGKWDHSETRGNIKYESSETIGMTYIQIPLRVNYHFTSTSLLSNPMWAPFMPQGCGAVLSIGSKRTEIPFWTKM